jgi:hypothetical protein
MTTLILLAVVCAIGLVFLVGKLLRHEQGSVPELVAALQNANVAALATVMSRSEQQYLRERLPLREFARVHRTRMATARGYLREFDTMCAQLGSALRGQAATEDLRVLADDLTAVRFTLFWLYLLTLASSVVPTIEASAGPVVEFHRRAVRTFAHMVPEADADGPAALRFQ